MNPNPLTNIQLSCAGDLPPAPPAAASATFCHCCMFQGGSAISQTLGLFVFHYCFPSSELNDSPPPFFVIRMHFLLKHVFLG